MLKKQSVFVVSYFKKGIINIYFCLFKGIHIQFSKYFFINLH